MSNMKVKDYLFLVKWLDSQGSNTLKTFILRYDINERVRVACVGKWNELTGEPEVDTVYENFLGFFVDSEDWGTGFGLEPFSEIRLKIVPIHHDYPVMKIPEALLIAAKRGDLWN